MYTFIRCRRRKTVHHADPAFRFDAKGRRRSRAAALPPIGAVCVPGAAIKPGIPKRLAALVLCASLCAGCSILPDGNSSSSPNSRSSSGPSASSGEPQDIRRIGAEQFYNLFRLALSPDGSQALAVGSNLGETPRVHRFDARSGRFAAVSDNPLSYPFDPCINDNGDFAYGVLDQNASVSSIVCNGEVIDTGQLNKCLRMAGDSLFYVKQTNSDSNVSRVYRFKRSTGELSQVSEAFPAYVGNLAALSESRLALEVWSPSTGSIDIYLLDVETGAMSVLCGSAQDELIAGIREDGTLRVERIGGDANASYLFGAFYWLERFRSNDAFFGTNDHTGRLGWNACTRLLGVLELYRRTGDQSCLDLIDAACAGLLAAKRAFPADSDESFLWSSYFYSTNRDSPIQLMVNNAWCIYPLLAASNAGLLSDADRADVLRIAGRMAEHYDRFWDENLSVYRFEYGVDFHLDGSVQPYNMSNIFGCVLLELYQATGDETYSRRATELAAKLKSEFVYPDDGRLLWRYWPQVFYEGWDESDNVSVHTPVREPSDNPEYEDVSHAGINVLFMQRYADTFGYGVFTGEDFSRLEKSLLFICLDGTYLDSLDGERLQYATPSSFWNLLGGGTGVASNPYLLEDYRHTGRFTSAEYDSQERLLGMASLYSPEGGGMLRVDSLVYSAEGALLSELQAAYACGDIPGYARLYRAD